MSPLNWDEQVAALGGHFYQSSHWAAFQEAQGYEILRSQGDGWLWQAALRTGRGGIKYLYCPYGPSVTSHESLVASLESLIKFGKEHDADFVKAEPWSLRTDDWGLATGWHEVPAMQPKHIMRLDISQSEDELRANISQSNRNLINQAEVRGLKFRVSTDAADLETFIRLQNETAKRGGFKMHPDSYYCLLFRILSEQGVAKLYFADHADGAVAVAVCYDFGGVRYYALAGTDDALNREHKGAIALLWWIISDAKSRGLVTLDYGGVAPEGDENHPWAGHTRFKKSIGGETITLAGTWDYPLKSTKYRLYRLVKKVLH